MSVEKADAKEERMAQGGFWNLSTIAKQRVADKRKKKGLGDVKPRNESVFAQLFYNGTTIAVAKTALAPLDRVKIIQQVKHIPHIRPSETPKGTIDTFSSNFSISNSFL